MNKAHTILLISSCTSRKAEAAVVGAEGIPAERLYVGEQHRRLMRGASAFRAASTKYALDIRILSAGYGLVHGSQLLKPYDASFSGLTRRARDERAEKLGVRRAVKLALSTEYGLVLFLLGDDYVRAAGLDGLEELRSPALAFGGARLARHLGGIPSLKIVPATKLEARRFSCGLVGLKGELGGRLLERFAESPELISRITEPDVDVLAVLDTSPHEAAGLAA